jgi:sodium-dependent phosphate cotransporter
MVEQVSFSKTLSPKIFSPKWYLLVSHSTHFNGYIGILIGAGITMITQSSSITTSVLVPFGAVGALRIEQAFPLVIGANLGTAINTVISAKDAFGTNPLQVALAHLFFNLTGALLFYPLPHLRRIPIWAATRLGRGAYIWRLFPVLYIATMFLAVPLLFEALSACFYGGTGEAVVGGFLSAGLGLGLAWLLYWCKYKGGDEFYLTWIERMTGRAVSTSADTTDESNERKSEEKEEKTADEDILVLP